RPRAREDCREGCGPGARLALASPVIPRDSLQRGRRDFDITFGLACPAPAAPPLAPMGYRRRRAGGPSLPARIGGRDGLDAATAAGVGGRRRRPAGGGLDAPDLPAQAVARGGATGSGDAGRARR